MSVTTQDPQHRIGDASERAGKGTSFAAATWLVAEREIKSFVRTKGFWIGFSVIIVALFATSILPKVFASSTSVAVVDSSANAVLEQAEIEVVSVTDVAAAEDLVREEEVDAAVVPDPTGESVTGVRVIALSSPPSEVVAALGTTPPVDLLEESEVGHGERTLVIMAFALLFLMFGIGGVAIAQSTAASSRSSWRRFRSGRCSRARSWDMRC